MLKWFVSVLISLPVFAQTTAPPPPATVTKIPLSADLVLSPDFCAPKTRPALGRNSVLCTQIAAALEGVFSRITRVNQAPAPGNHSAQLVLIPRLVDMNTTQPFFGSSQSQLLLLVEWTIQDASGRPIWLQTVEGTSHHKMGWFFRGKNQAIMTEAAVDELAKASRMKILTAPELRQRPAHPAPGG